jgi:archaellum component FlaC
MGLFSKQEKKLLLGLGEKNIQSCKDAVKELEELFNDVKSAYEDLGSITEDFQGFIETIHHKLEGHEQVKLTAYAKKLGKAEKAARDAVRDVRDVLRNQKKRLKEAQRDVI